MFKCFNTYSKELININTNNITNYKHSEFSELLNVSVKTLQRWDRDKVLIARRTPTNRRYYTYDQYLEYKGFDSEDKNSRKTILYTRVSTNNQKDDLKNQILFLQNFVNAKGMIVDEVVEDIVSILHIFSCRIYGMRKYKKKIEEDRDLVESVQNRDKANTRTKD